MFAMFTFHVITITTLLAGFPTVFAKFYPTSKDNIAVYWGQNSLKMQNNKLSQHRLSYYCQNTNINVIIDLSSLDHEVENFSISSGACKPINGTDSVYCPELEQDISECQEIYGKTILLSLGGGMYAEGGFRTKEAAVTAAKNIWANFGPNTSGSRIRPFGKSVVDGFDFDIEMHTENMVPFAQQLRSLMDRDTKSGGKRYYLTAAPQCPYPDTKFGPLLNGTVNFDVLMIQFYNNFCGADSFVPGHKIQKTFNFATWDTWAKNISKNPNVKILLGLPGAMTVAQRGFVYGSNLASLIKYTQNFSSFAGVMIWDMTEIYNNTKFFDEVVLNLSPTTPSMKLVSSSSDSAVPFKKIPSTSSASSIWTQRYDAWIILLSTLTYYLSRERKFFLIF